MVAIDAVSDDQLREIYLETRIVAVVGASSDAAKPANKIPLYVQSQGFRVIPVSPKGGELFGENVYPSLAEVPEKVDVVNVFRPADEAPEIARQAVAVGAKVLWLQSGIASDEAKRVAEQAGMTVVMDRCIGQTHGRLGLGPGP